MSLWLGTCEISADKSLKANSGCVHTKIIIVEFVPCSVAQLFYKKQVWDPYIQLGQRNTSSLAVFASTIIKLHVLAARVQVVGWSAQ